MYQFMLIYEPQFEFMLPVTSYFHNILMDSIPNINDNNDNEQTIILPLKKSLSLSFHSLFLSAFKSCNCLMTRIHGKK